MILNPASFTEHTYRGLQPFFYRSTLAQGFVPYLGNGLDTIPECLGHAKSVIAHKVLLVHLLSLSVDTSSESIDAVAEIVADVIAYAELYDFLPQVASGLSRELRQCSKLWEDITTNPQFYLAVAVKLKDEAVFVEALRHVAATTRPNEYLGVFKAVADTTGLTEQDVEQLINKYRYKLDIVMEDVLEIITRHTLPSHHVPNLGEPTNLTLAVPRTHAEYHKALFRHIAFKEWFDRQWIAAKKEKVYERYR